ncbi:MAG: hypothetical protein IPP55_05430 [Anaerolineales bacterium]|nr:hypothetical protein [Anaerolineales bacterium]
MNNRKRVLMGVLLITGILLTACGGGNNTPVSDSGSPTDASGGSAAAPVTVDLTLDPANLPSDNANAAAIYLYEGLVRLQSGTVEAALAETVTISEDGLDYIFTLRQGVTFHDGTLLTADAVILNFNRWFDPGDANRGAGSYAAWAASFGGFKGEVTEDGKPKSHVDGIEKQDEYNLIVHLNAPDVDLLTKLTDPSFSIISPAMFAGGDGGTGPYKVVAANGDTLTLEPFAGYWDAASIPSKAIEVPAP